MYSKHLYKTVAQLIEWWTVEQKVSGSNTDIAMHFLNDISFKWENEPKGEQYEKEEQLQELK